MSIVKLADERIEEVVVTTREVLHAELIVFITHEHVHIVDVGKRALVVGQILRIDTRCV